VITRRQVFEQSKSAVSQFVRYSLCNEQNYPMMEEVGRDTWTISIGKKGGYSIALHNLSYSEIYSSFTLNKLFDFKMIDGALIQMLYKFQGDKLLYHRLAFFPSPNLADFQNNAELYEMDEIYADIIRKEIVPFPIRFDFDISDDKHTIIEHPKSHLTLGQYTNCRIPVSAPLTPFIFLSFILRNFYNTAFCKFMDSLKLSGVLFDDSIHLDETCIPHLKLPNG
jgi:hypothetical protein